MIEQIGRAKTAITGSNGVRNKFQELYTLNGQGMRGTKDAKDLVGELHKQLGTGTLYTIAQMLFYRQNNRSH